MKFIRNPKPVIAQRSRARHLAYKRRPKPVKAVKPILAKLFEKHRPDDELVRAFDMVAGMLRLDPKASRDYLEWLDKQIEDRIANAIREENREETSPQKTGQKRAGN
jgi:hypothetical protein